jgi:hypothetical protein
MPVRNGRCSLSTCPGDGPCSIPQIPQPTAPFKFSNGRSNPHNLSEVNRRTGPQCSCGRDREKAVMFQQTPQGSNRHPLHPQGVPGRTTHMPASKSGPQTCSSAVRDRDMPDGIPRGVDQLPIRNQQESTTAAIAPGSSRTGARWRERGFPLAACCGPSPWGPVWWCDSPCRDCLSTYRTTPTRFDFVGRCGGEMGKVLHSQSFPQRRLQRFEALQGVPGDGLSILVRSPRRVQSVACRDTLMLLPIWARQKRALFCSRRDI